MCTSVYNTSASDWILYWRKADEYTIRNSAPYICGVNWLFCFGNDLILNRLFNLTYNTTHIG